MDLSNKYKQSSSSSPVNNDNDDDERNNTIIISIVENRAREICISKIDSTNYSILEIYIMQDNHAYTGTYTIIFYLIT